MHPPLDRPHPDCQEAIQALKECHEEKPWYQKYTGVCNNLKYALDRCFKQEKERGLAIMNQDLPQRRLNQEDIVKNAFGRNMTFSEYLQKDQEYQQALSQKKKKAEAEQHQYSK